MANGRKCTYPLMEVQRSTSRVNRSLLTVTRCNTILFVKPSTNARTLIFTTIHVYLFIYIYEKQSDPHSFPIAFFSATLHKYTRWNKYTIFPPYLRTWKRLKYVVSRTTSLQLVSTITERVCRLNITHISLVQRFHESDNFAHGINVIQTGHRKARATSSNGLTRLTLFPLSISRDPHLNEIYSPFQILKSPS